MRWLSIIFVCFALARVAGLDLAVMQIQAWAEMIYDRSEQGFSQAVASAFSGEAPCDKCKQLKEHREEQHNNEFCIKSLDKLKLPHAPDDAEVAVYSLDEIVQDFPPCLDLSSTVYLGTESPPPRV